MAQPVVELVFIHPHTGPFLPFLGPLGLVLDQGLVQKVFLDLLFLPLEVQPYLFVFYQTIFRAFFALFGPFGAIFGAWGPIHKLFWELLT